MVASAKGAQEAREPMSDKLEAAGLAVIEAAIADAEQDFKRPHLRSHLLGARVQGNRPRGSSERLDARHAPRV